MSEPLTVTERIVIPASDLSYEFSRAGGPGGQHVNTTDTRVRMRFALSTSTALPPPVAARLREAHAGKLDGNGDLMVVSDASRSRLMNVEAARDRLVSWIRDVLAPPKRRYATKPTRTSQVKRVETKKRRSNVKQGRGRIRED